MVRSTKAHAKVLNVDTSEALKLPGVVGQVSSQDLAAPMSDIFCDDLVS